jgi:hypothetical protein
MDRLDTTLRNSITQFDPQYYKNNNGTCEASSDGALWDYVQVKVKKYQHVVFKWLFILPFNWENSKGITWMNVKFVAIVQKIT